MKWLYRTVVRKTGLGRILRIVYMDSNDTIQPRRDWHDGGRRVSRQQDYLRYTGGVDRRRNRGRRAEDRLPGVSFIGEFL